MTTPYQKRFERVAQPSEVEGLDSKFNDAATCKAFVRTLHANLDNDKLSDSEFREFVRNCLQSS